MSDIQNIQTDGDGTNKPGKKGDIDGLVLLPPIAIARLGSSEHPVDAYDLIENPDDPTGYRQIKPIESLYVDPDNGEISRVAKPDKIKFRDGDRIRPVAPFFQVYARMRNGEIRPLTLDMMKIEEWEPDEVAWTVSVANHKAFRRTGDENDRVQAEVVVTHEQNVKTLRGTAENFVAGKYIPLGQVRCIRPSASKRTPESDKIRLRFTPATGKIYGASANKFDENRFEVKDPLFEGHADRIVYDSEKGKWRGFTPPNDDPTASDPDDVYEGYPQDINKSDLPKQSQGYLDDICDGRVTVEIGRFKASALISVGVPAFAPDSLPIRTVADEIEQALLGPVAAPDGDYQEDAIQIVRRALDTIRHMNTAALNGNTIDGQSFKSASTAGGDSVLYGRKFEPTMTPSLVDNLAVRMLHGRILGALQSGSAPWFARVLRQPEEIGDLSNEGRRKMPPILRGSDGCALTLTRRQISKIEQTQGAISPMQARNLSALATPQANDPSLIPLVEKLIRPEGGNPISALPVSTIANCFPGLEFDFRNFWRNAFEEIVLLEWDNLVLVSKGKPLDLDGQPRDLTGHRLLLVDGWPIVVPMRGPTDTASNPATRLTDDDNPEGAMTMALSDALAFAVLKQGQTVTCHFTKKPSEEAALPTFCRADMLEVKLKVRQFFEPTTATPGSELVEPGQLTQSLCSPWQHDYRECACYYWPATRPDFVNVTSDANGVSQGDNWMAKERTGRYVLDDRRDSRVYSYEDIFMRWEELLYFVIAGQDSKDGTS